MRKLRGLTQNVLVGGAIESLRIAVVASFVGKADSGSGSHRAGFINRNKNDEARSYRGQVEAVNHQSLRETIMLITRGR